MNHPQRPAECTAHDLRGHLEQMVADGTSCPHCIELARYLLAVHPSEVTR